MLVFVNNYEKACWFNLLEKITQKVALTHFLASLVERQAKYLVKVDWSAHEAPDKATDMPTQIVQNV